MSLSEDLEAEAVKEDQVAELRRALVRTQRQLGQAKAKTADLVQAVYTAAADSALAAGRPAVVMPSRDRRTKGIECALVHASDWQIGKGTVSFNPEVGAIRLRTLARKVGEITEIQRADHPVKECWVILGGDMVEGVSIFPGQPWEVTATLYEQLFTTANLEEQLILDLLAIFDAVHVVCEYGNHGRIGRKGEFPGQDNIDLISYGIVAERFKDESRVTWQMSTNWYQMLVIGSYRALVVHGDEIKSFGGNTPAFGIIRKSGAWKTALGESFHDVYMGHFHTYMTLPLPDGRQIYVNGTIESDNEYAREFVAARGDPCQRLHFIDPEKGRVTGGYQVYLDEE